jgi:hypothetical protein
MEGAYRAFPSGIYIYFFLAAIGLGCKSLYQLAFSDPSFLFQVVCPATTTDEATIHLPTQTPSSFFPHQHFGTGNVNHAPAQHNNDQAP